MYLATKSPNSTERERTELAGKSDGEVLADLGHIGRDLFALQDAICVTAAAPLRWVCTTQHKGGIECDNESDNGNAHGDGLNWCECRVFALVFGSNSEYLTQDLP